MCNTIKFNVGYTGNTVKILHRCPMKTPLICISAYLLAENFCKTSYYKAALQLAQIELLTCLKFMINTSNPRIQRRKACHLEKLMYDGIIEIHSTPQLKILLTYCYLKSSELLLSLSALPLSFYHITTQLCSAFCSAEWNHMELP